MKSYAQKFSRGLPRYDGIGSTISALSISPDTLRAAQDADALLAREWEQEFLPTPPVRPSRPVPAAAWPY
ncbi:hypothetical protein [Hymenobacter swuensis]|uniref:Uncharacterized protein n=1 Tax=Hymenobacter swuensis DY53 TaxID=1227739 RepID=W8EWT3_9BACT|nr:hypothetical protein [Hymenobacter swuensis]AHJ97529.1 hypothetical protein Hsw_1934 [Hymenobacter swuensis DY53]